MSSNAGGWELTRALRISFVFVLVCVLLALVGTWAFGAMVRSAVKRLPPAWEQKFGDKELAELQKKFDFSEDTNQLAALRAATEPLLRVVSEPGTRYTFHILQVPVPNAFALPGGHVIVTSGMLQMVGSQEELLGVIAHELAHVTLKHAFRHMISTAGPVLICRVFMGAGNLDLLGKGSGLLVYQSFSQEYEMEADNQGWDYLVAANINPTGMINVFRSLDMFHGGDVDVIPRAFSSHPTMRKRIVNLDARWRKLPKKSGFLVLTNALPVPIEEDGQKNFKLRRSRR
ncbi:MAG TPA: M48 family metallopeptidase [Verrucomicrobiae bacterium]|nr:M48 family metallopeptidase [Verrucomicrobiae bacterium]